MKNTRKDYSSSCKMSFFHYVQENPDENASLSDVMQHEKIDFLSTDIDCPIVTFNYTKTNNAGAGFFQIVLAPTDNWLQRLKPGDWVTVYLNNGVQGFSRRLVGNIDRVAAQESIDPSNGARSVKYVITGQDYGKVFEKYWIYIHPYILESLTTSFLIPQVLGVISDTAGGFIKKFLEVFLGYSSSGATFFSLPAYLQQWLIPQKLAQELSTQGVVDAFNTGRPPNFYDILNKDNIRMDLPGEVQVYLLNINNSLWNIMKENSNPYINELLCEMDSNNVPSLTFRTIPFLLQRYNADARIADTLTRFIDLNSAKISGAEILSSVIDLNEQTRFNFTLLNSTQVKFNGNTPLDSISLLQGQFPYLNKSSCHRYGTLVYEGTSNQLLKNKNNWDQELLLSWNRLIRDWMKDNAHYENITLNIMGNNNIRTGKRLDIIESPLTNGLSNNFMRSYYIESYSDNWNYPGSWTQTITGTRGIFIDNSNNSEYFTYEKMTKGHSLTSSGLIKRKA